MFPIPVSRGISFGSCTVGMRLPKKNTAPSPRAPFAPRMCLQIRVSGSARSRSVIQHVRVLLMVGRERGLVGRLIRLISLPLHYGICSNIGKASS